MNKKTGFTLIELLLVIAIIAILSGTILVAVGSQRQRANEARALAELSGAMQPIVMCHSDDGNVLSPDPGQPICSIGANYGTWPTPPGNDFNPYQFGGDFNGDDWFFYIEDGTVAICCNNLSSRCDQISWPGACNGTTAL